MIRSADPTDFQPDDARFFEAVRYLLDEMTPVEVDRFEEALAIDQSLRELLAEAVLVTHATYAAHLPENELPRVESAERPAEASPPGAAPRREDALPRTLLALAAALLVAAAGGLWMWGMGPATSDVANDASNEQIHLASAWVERLEDQSQGNTTLWNDDLLTASPTDDSSESEEDALLVSPSTNPPAWMLKALAAQQEDELSAPTM
ncbi:hypothetical protein [Blastopirellula marina]|uniref:Uncharacterized protein n=1 Tax=Blastopirellula marina TaxID=124 RepID=A0A2S8GTP8_9BACT|nr:hypothetical protein [Blastopirellula marina]PQO47786.1 hypothetical protein C5Y93_01720 [Blastopirellula marina]